MAALKALDKIHDYNLNITCITVLKIIFNRFRKSILIFASLALIAFKKSFLSRTMFGILDPKKLFINNSAKEIISSVLLMINPAGAFPATNESNKTGLPVMEPLPLGVAKMFDLIFFPASG